MKISRHILSAIMVCGLLLACGKKETEMSMLWEDEKMVNVLFDLRIMDNQIKKHHVLDRDSVAKEYIEHIYKIHGITESDLSYHLEIIQKDAKLARALEDKVLKKMVKRQKTFEKDDDYQ